MKIENVEQIISDSFGLWISGLFSAISGWNSGIAFEEHKVAFFELLEMLLKNGKVKFCPPKEFWKEGYEVWDADVQTIIQYLQVRWPENAISENDLALTDYFYEIPAILWVSADGRLHGS
jgi:hypothetical protein